MVSINEDLNVEFMLGIKGGNVERINWQSQGGETRL